jgi:threonine dehydratase
VSDLVGLADVEAAAARVGASIHRTPVLTCGALDVMAGRSLVLKAEPFQKTGSFKIRGALNKVLSLTDVERRKGIVTLSAGNAAAAYSLAARMAGVAATVVMPSAAVPAKVDAVRAYGGTVVQADDLLGTYEAVRDERGLVACHPFDDPAMIAGNGTLGLELLADAPDVDTIVVPVGGGGLISGVAAVAHERGVRIVGVEPTGAAIVARSLAAGEPLRASDQRSVADGLMPPMAGLVTQAHVAAYVSEMVQVDDDAILDAMRLIITRMKVVVEPSAAAGLAAVLGGLVPSGDRVAVVLSGGNLNLSLLASP